MLLSQLLKHHAKADARAEKLSGTPADVDVETYLAKFGRSADENNVRALLGYSKSDVHADQFMPNFSVGFRGYETLIADLVSPIVPVNYASDKFVVWDRATAHATSDDEVGPLGDPREVEQSFSSDTYTTTGRALIAKVANDIVANADGPLDLLSEAAEDVRWRLAKNREKRIADVVMAGATYATALKTTLAGATQWTDVTTGTSNPIEDIFTLLKKSDWAAPCNAFVMSDEVWMMFRKHPKVTAALASSLTVGAQGPMATVEGVKSFFSLEHVLIGNAKRNTANPAATASYGRVWGKAFAMLRITPGARMKDLSFMKSFRHQALSYETINDPKPGVSGVTIVKGSYSEGDKVVSQAAGALIIDAVA